jgi:S-adenosylmethionine hydrolase
MKRTILVSIILIATSAYAVYAQPKALVFQTDFGLKDGAVSAMKGVAYGVSPTLAMFDLTHEIPAYNIWEAAYRLHQTATYWPKGTVFVSVVDPGVGSERKSVVLKTRSGHFFVTPDNGTLTLVAEHLGIEEIRQIDERINRLKNSEQSYTFHGRDVYAYTGARLAAGIITFEQVGAALPKQVVQIPYQKPSYENGTVKGNIPVLDVQYGNVWSNIDKQIFDKLGAKPGDKLSVLIYKNKDLVFDGDVTYANTFAEVKDGENLGYINSLLNFSVAVNQASFSEKYHVNSGAEWLIQVKKAL